MCRSVGHEIRSNSIFPVKELIIEEDAEEEEENQTKKKFNERAELVDKKAILNMNKMELKASAMKCYYGFNRCGERDKNINARAFSDDCRGAARKKHGSMLCSAQTQ